MNLIGSLAGKHRGLAENFGHLTVLQGLNVAFPLLTFPYLIRVLGPSTYGEVVLAQNIAGYFALLVHFGFSSTAPADVATVRDDSARLSEVVSGVLTARTLVWFLSAAAYLAMVALVPSLHAKWELYAWSFGLSLGPLLALDWYFQGVERMKFISLATLVARGTSLLGLVIFVRGPEHFLRVPMITTLGLVVAGVWNFTRMRRDGVGIHIANSHQVRRALGRGAPMFASSALVSVADKGAAILIGTVFGPIRLAQYDLAEKLITAISTIFSNVARTIYPHLARTRDHLFSRSVTRTMLVVSLGAATLLWVGAPLLVAILGGKEMSGSVELLRILTFSLPALALGPLFAQVLLIENHHRSIWPNSLLAGLVPALLVAGIAQAGQLTVGAVALSIVLGLLVRSAHRYFLTKRFGLSDWF